MEISQQDINKTIIENFKFNLNSVIELSNFDNIILDFAIECVSSLSDRLKLSGFHNQYLSAEQTLTQLKNVKINDSLRPKYEKMFNQCIVLFVSYFTLSLRDIFVNNIRDFLKENKSDEILNEEFKISIRDIVSSEFNFSNQIGEWILTKKDVSFQDMKSIRRIFSKYFSIELEKDNNMDNIIFAQASRHIIVHNGGKIDDKFLSQIKATDKRDLKKKFKKQEYINFERDELRIIANSMLSFTTNILEKIC